MKKPLWKILVFRVLTPLLVLMGIIWFGNTLLENGRRYSAEYSNYQKDTLKRAEQKAQSGQKLSPDEQRARDSYNNWKQNEYDKKQRARFGD